MAVTVGGTDWDIINVDVDETDTEITYVRPVKTFAIFSRNRKELQWRRTENAVKYVTLYPGVPANSEVLLGNSSASASSLGWIRTADGSDDVIEGIVTY